MIIMRFLFKIFTVLLIGLIFYPINIFGQSDEFSGYEFESFTVQDGLSSDIVYSLLQDKEGYIYVGTSTGLDRYDGIRFSKMPILSTTTTHKQNPIRCLAEDEEENIWIGSRLSGLIKYDKKNKYFTHFNQNPYQNSISDNFIWAVICDTGNIIYAATRSGVDKFDTKKELFSKLENESSVSGIFRFIKDDKNRIWARSSKGVLILYPKLMKLRLVDFSNLNMNLNSLGTIIEEPGSEGRVFWISANNLFVRIDIKSRETDKFDLLKLDPNLDKGRITNFLFDKNGDLWIGSRDGLGILKKNKNNFNYIPLVNNKFKAPGFSGNTISGILQDKAGVIWVSTENGGINKYEQRKIVVSPFDDSISKRYRDILSVQLVANKLYLGVKQGLLEYDLTSKEQKVYDNLNSSPKKYSIRLTDIYQQPSDPNILWIASAEEGIHRFNIKTKLLEKFWRRKMIKVLSYDCVMEDDNQNIWFGTTSSGIYKYFPKSDSIYSFSNNANKSAPKGGITVLYNTKKGGIWIGTDGDGLHKYNSLKDDFINDILSRKDSTLKNLIINAIKEDANDNLWIGTSRGLVKLNVLTNEFKLYPLESKSRKAAVLSLEFDSSGNLWVSSMYNICRFDIRREMFSVYSPDKGQNTNYLPNCSQVLPDGKILFGGYWNISYIDPGQLNSHRPEIVITQIKLADQEPMIDPVLKDHFLVSLSYDENYFSIEFNALSFASPGRNKFIYMLEGYDKEWIESGMDRIARYTNVEPGEYIFEVKGSNCDGVWNEKGASFAVTILPPFYKTTWAYLFYVILLILFIYGIVKFFLYRDRLQNEAILKRKEAEQLQQLDQIKSRFFANISHELRTPLTLIIGPLESLISKEKGNGNFQLMYNQAKKLLNMINQLLDISRLESGKMRLKISKRDIIQHSQALISSFHPLAAKRKIKLSLISPHTELKTYYDADKYEKILINLLSNAFKFSPNEDEIIVTIESSNLTEFKGQPFPEGYIQITVKDNGSGIPETSAEKIFERFYQLENQNVKKFGGTGLGLSIVKDFVELHGGLIYINTKVEKGAEFNFILPLGKSTFKDAEFEQYFEESESQTSTETLQNTVEIEITEPEKEISSNDAAKIILVIEDHEEVNDYIKNILSKYYKVIQSYDGESGLSAALKTVPDLIVSDIMMPGIDGYEVCKQLKTDEITSHIPVILLTAKASLDSKIEGLETGADDYITKPFSEEELKLRIKNLIATREKLREKFAGQLNLNPTELSVTSADEKFLNRVKEVVEKNLPNPDFNVEDFSGKVGMSRMTLHRKLKAVTGLSAKELIQEMRLRRAAQLLEKNIGTIAEVAYEVGFKEPSYFTKCFQKRFNVLPSEYVKHEISPII